MNNAQTIKINETLKNIRSVVADFTLAADGYTEYECDDSAYTLFLSDTKRKIEKLVSLGLPTSTKLIKLHGIAIFTYEQWATLNSERISSLFTADGKVNFNNA